MDEHVLLLGCGRVGRLVAAALEKCDVPYIALEADIERFERAKSLGHRVILGDGSRVHLLNAAGLARVRLLVVTFDHEPSLERILHHARHARAPLHALVSASDDNDLERIRRAGATVVYPENLAGGLALGSQALSLLGFSNDQATKIILGLRSQLSPELSGHVGI